jgi:glucose-1-phosphate adenylyltransferase
VDDHQRIIGFDEKPQQPRGMPGRPELALASMGIYIFDARFLLDVLQQDAGVSESSHDFGKDIIPSAIRGASAYAYPFRDLYDANKQGYWRDVGTVDAYWRSNIELTDVLPELDLYDSRWPIWTHSPHVPPAKFILDKPGERGSAADSIVSGGSIISGASIRRSVVFSNTRVEPGTEVDGSLMLPNVTIGRHCRIQNAVIDEGCTIADGTIIGANLEQDRKHYHVSKSGIVLVTREMLEQ